MKLTAEGGNPQTVTQVSRGEGAGEGATCDNVNIITQKILKLQVTEATHLLAADVASC